MKARFVFAVVMLVAVLLFRSNASDLQSDGSFTITESTIDAGGGTSSGGSFAVSGTVGQHDAGMMIGGSFTVEGGFWTGIQLFQLPNGPLLKIKIVGSNAVVSWPLSTTGYQLQWCADLGSATWANEPTSVVDTADEHTVTVPAQGVIKLFRLKK